MRRRDLFRDQSGLCETLEIVIAASPVASPGGNFWFLPG